MQKRYSDRSIYFKELATTSRDFYIDYIQQYKNLSGGVRVLEVGCGEGGNLLPFAELGCSVKGIDLTKVRIEHAKDYFEAEGFEGDFTLQDFFDMKPNGEKYDLILIHDVIEHIPQKDAFIKHVEQFLAKGGLVFWRFPAWQMPFGGHQQICSRKISSHLPFYHILPKSAYRSMLKWFGEEKGTVKDLLEIKECAMTIEAFERLMNENRFTTLDRTLWFINPHYQQKFNLKPRKLYPFLAKISYVRNFFSTSCYYITKKDGN